MTTLPTQMPAVSFEEEIPRPEYPRPQFVRPEWLNLNGLWDFQFDDANRGLQERWPARPPKFSHRILVPFSFETARSGIGDPSFHCCVWYCRRIQVPEGWRGRRILLHFGAVDYRATVWVNGILVGTHEGGHTPFVCEITVALQDQEAEIVVRAEDPPTDRYIPRGKQYWEEKAAGIFYARTTGIWQTVWMEPVPDSYLESVRITPAADGSVVVEAKVANPQRQHVLKLEVRRDGELLASPLSLADGPRICVELNIANPDLWSPDSPSLYELQLELLDGDGTVDSVSSYFGFRFISTLNGKVLLNGQPLYLKTALDQGYWPETNLTPPDDEAIQFDIRIAKQMGFNGVRKHQKVEDPRYLYWADRMGLLVSAEMANAYLFNEDSVVRMTREWMEVVSRDYNHPSIVIWVPINESWGVPNIMDMRQQAHLKALYYLTKSIDSTRLVIDNDGWEHTEATDLFAIHDYTQTGEELLERYAENNVPLTLKDKLYLAPGHSYSGAPVFLSEFGGVAYVLPEDRGTIPDDSWGYSEEFTPEAALRRMRSLYQAISQIPKIAGICYTQLYDVEQEVNGLLTYDRRLKFDPAAIAALNSLLR